MTRLRVMSRTVVRQPTAGGRAGDDWAGMIGGVGATFGADVFAGAAVGSGLVRFFTSEAFLHSRDEEGRWRAVEVKGPAADPCSMECTTGAHSWGTRRVAEHPVHDPATLKTSPTKG